MTVDLACGDLAFVDLTFPALDGLPGLGEERHATDFVRSPGGAAITAIGAARLGLSVALASPIGADADGDFLRERLAAEGVRWVGRTVARTAVTVVLPVEGDRAMATYDPGEQVTAGDLAAVAPRAVVLSLPRLGAAPAGARV
jgi:ribokinase